MVPSPAIERVKSWASSARPSQAAQLDMEPNGMVDTIAGSSSSHGGAPPPTLKRFKAMLEGRRAETGAWREQREPLS